MTSLLYRSSVHRSTSSPCLVQGRKTGCPDCHPLLCRRFETRVSRCFSSNLVIRCGFHHPFSMIPTIITRQRELYPSRSARIRFEDRRRPRNSEGVFATYGTVKKFSFVRDEEFVSKLTRRGRGGETVFRSFDKTRLKISGSLQRCLHRCP